GIRSTGCLALPVPRGAPNRCRESHPAGRLGPCVASRRCAVVRDSTPAIGANLRRALSACVSFHAADRYKFPQLPWPSAGLALSHDSAQRSGTAPFLIATSRARINFTAPSRCLRSMLLIVWIVAEAFAGIVTRESS